MTSEAEVAATGVGGGLVLGLAFAVGVVVVSRGEGAVGLYDLADAAEMVAGVVVAIPVAAVLALLALGEVAAVDGGTDRI